MTAQRLTSCVYQTLHGAVVQTDAPWEICARLYRVGQEVVLHRQRYRVLACTVEGSTETVVIAPWPWEREE